LFSSTYSPVVPQQFSGFFQIRRRFVTLYLEFVREELCASVAEAPIGIRVRDDGHNDVIRSIPQAFNSSTSFVYSMVFCASVRCLLVIPMKTTFFVRSLDDMTITFGSMIPFPDPLHGGAYPSVTVYDHCHDEDRVRLQLNDTGVPFTFFALRHSRPADSEVSEIDRLQRRLLHTPQRSTAPNVRKLATTGAAILGETNI
jgi:hypothetical protein